MFSTIVAIASANIPAGVGVIRLSGPKAKEIAHKIVKGHRTDLLSVSHRLYLVQFADSDHKVFDHGLCSWMEAPHTYTGEEVVEFYPHGSPYVMRRLLESCYMYGAEAARAGEFTQRAFLNNKLDLTQAESVAQLIDAESEQEAQWAQRRLSGELKTQVENLYQELNLIIAECEADIDFPDENLPLKSREDILRKVERVRFRLKDFITSYQSVEKLRSGFEVVFFGPPNVGKSSLFNALLQENRALVSSTAGTTRDALREELNLEGLRLKIIDSAGIRIGSHDQIEHAGMQLSWQIADRSDVLCILLSPDLHGKEKDHFMGQIVAYIKRNPKKDVFVLWNKQDLSIEAAKAFLPPELSEYPKFSLSAKHKQGIEPFREALVHALKQKLEAGKTYGGIQNERQRALFLSAQHRFEEAIQLWHKNEEIEIAAGYLREVSSLLAEVLGKTDINEDVLDQIFSHFCIGK